MGRGWLFSPIAYDPRQNSLFEFWKSVSVKKLCTEYSPGVAKITIDTRVSVTKSVSDLYNKISLCNISDSSAAKTV